MHVVDLLIMIIVVTILVTIVLGIMTYIAYKLRLARRPVAEADGSEHRFFVRHDPPGEAATPIRGGTRAGASAGDAHEPGRASADVA